MPDGKSKFGTAAGAAGYSSGERTGMERRFGEAGMNDKFGNEGSGKFSREVEKSHLVAFFRSFLDCSLEESWRGDNNELSDLGQILHDFANDEHLDDEGLNEVSILIKLVEESFYDGTILKAANVEGSRDDVFSMLAFVVNKLVKIQEKYSRKESLARIDQDRMEKFVGDVGAFVGEENGGIFNEDEKTKILESRNAIIEDADARKNGTGGLYLVKSTLVVASGLRSVRKNDGDEQNFLKWVDYHTMAVKDLVGEFSIFIDPILLGMANARISEICKNDNLYDGSTEMEVLRREKEELSSAIRDEDEEGLLKRFGDMYPYTTFDFDGNKFGVGYEDGRFNPQRRVHVRPGHMMFAAASALYLEKKAGIVG